VRTRLTARDMAPTGQARALKPPRAAVRQLSMADMTLNWPRLT
jgi:hypothetical protein